MIEIIILFFLCRANYKNANARGKNGVLFIFITLALWIVLEVIGVKLGMGTSYRPDLMTGMLYGLVLAAIGGAISYFWAKAGPIVKTTTTNEAHKKEDDNNNNIVV